MDGATAVGIPSVAEISVAIDANASFDYPFVESQDEKTPGHLVISRVYPQKEEMLTVYGTEGIIEVARGCIRRLNCQGGEIERLERKGSWPSAAIDQLEFFATEIQQFHTGCDVPLHEHLAHVAFIEAAYESDKLGRSCNPHTYLEQLCTPTTEKGAAHS
jgi:predicted dehydrogenase